MMLSTERKVAAAALLLLLSQDDDFDSLIGEDEEEPPPPLPKPAKRASTVVKSISPAMKDDIASLPIEVGEPIDQYLPGASDSPPKPQADRDYDDGQPFYVPPPSKKKKKKKRSSRASMDHIEESAANQDRKKKRSLWTQRMYLQRDYPPDHPLSEGIPYLDPSEELKTLRMSEECFEKLLSMVSPLITKQATTMREPISPKQRLVAVLRSLVTGQSHESLKFTTLLSPTTMNSVLPETCNAIIQVLSPEYMKFPEKKEDWQKIARQFSESCDFPNCGGSLNARHVNISKGIGTQNHINHRGYSSVVLATLVDANHRFVAAEVILDERESDQDAILKTDFFRKLSHDSLDLPTNVENEGDLDFVFTAPTSFPLHERILTAYPVKHVDDHAKLTYNDKVRTVNRYSENALGLLASRFGVFRSSIMVQRWKIDSMVRACCAIHNFLSVEGKDEYISENTYDGNVKLGEWRNISEAHYCPLETNLHYPSPDADRTREEYKDYFSSKLMERNLNLVE